MSCLFDPDPDPDLYQAVLGGLHPAVSSVHLSRRQWPRVFLPGRARRSHPLRWHDLLGRPQAGSYADRFPQLVKVRLRARSLDLGCRNVLSFDAKPIPGLGLLHRTHGGSLIGVGVAIGIGIKSAHRSKQPARYQPLIPTLTPIKHP
jgi:hypothetical protein